MPIGVPKVAFRLPGESVPQWIDLYNRLYREGLLFLCNELDDELANQLIGIMLYLSSEDENRELFVYINSPGGSVYAGLGIYDTMQFINPEVATICTGIAASMSAVLLCAGEKGKRSGLTHSRVMIHQPLGGAQGQASDIEITTREILSLKEELYKIISKHTGQDYEKVYADSDRDYWMKADKALEYGMIDEILTKS